ncbi:hypothetical protein CF15_02030 [Pyrodictium occultum]|uniref:Hemerythrin-like domain-containing protein n=1 Tax=Pyrodictium occultum TaxID=2309 RepID=A0A0V8RU91_PYROC|nr:hypothetical protein CF15_02030 [Pyrodictium occultum]
MEVGVDRIPEALKPVPHTLPPPYNYAASSIEWNSRLLDDPGLVLQLLEAAEAREEFEARLPGLRGQVRHLVTGRLAEKAGPRLLILEGERLSAWLLTYGVVVTAVRLEEPGVGVSYGLQALHALDEWTGSVKVVAARLRPYVYHWGPELSVYIKGLDNQHRYLVTVLNNLYISLLAGEEKEVVDDVLKSLVDYTRFHFRSEEKLFDKYGYPRAEAHRRQHQSFVEKVTEFNEQYEAGEKQLTLSVLRFLSDWVRNHILVSDHDYGEWFYRKGLPIVDEEAARESRLARRKLGLD